MSLPLVAKARLAILALVAALLIPIGTSTLGGLTHILTCREVVPTSFSLVVGPDGKPEVLSALALDAESSEGLCGGLLTDIEVGSDQAGEANVTLLVTNETPHAWRGTVELQLGDVAFPVGIRTIAAGATEQEEVSIQLEPGTLEVAGSLLIGP